MINGFHTVRVVAEKLNVTEETVRRWIREKKLKATKIRIKGLKEAWGISPAALREFMAHYNNQLS